MSKNQGTVEKTAPAVKVVAKVSRRHARKFVDAFFSTWRDCGATDEALNEAGLRKWPDESDDVSVTSTPEQDECCALDDAILVAVAARLRGPLEEVFLDVASDVVGRYRSGELMIGRAILGKAIDDAILRGLTRESVTVKVCVQGKEAAIFWTDARRIPIRGDHVFLGHSDRWPGRCTGLVTSINSAGAMRVITAHGDIVVTAAEIATGSVEYLGTVDGEVRRADSSPRHWDELMARAEKWEHSS